MSGGLTARPALTLLIPQPYHDTYAEARERYTKEKADFDAQHAATEQ